MVSPDPEKYDGCRIIVQGFLGEFDYPRTKLFLSRDDQLVGGSLFGALPISFQQKKASIDFDQVKRARGDYVLFQGRVFASCMDTALPTSGKSSASNRVRPSTY